MSEENDLLLEALTQAMDQELKAREFYRDAAKKVTDPRGRDLLQQLADFEDYHYQSLKAHYEALSSGQAPPPYRGREIRPGLEAGQGGRECRDLETAVDVLTMAIEAEREAQARYEAWAEEAASPSAQALFHRLAHEESVHARILNDEFYSLSNRGIWLWGD